MPFYLSTILTTECLNMVEMHVNHIPLVSLRLHHLSPKSSHIGEYGVIPMGQKKYVTVAKKVNEMKKKYFQDYPMKSEVIGFYHLKLHPLFILIALIDVMDIALYSEYSIRHLYIS